MKKILPLVAFVFYGFASNAADNYKLDPSHTNITWQADHFGFSSQNGKFAEVEGDLLLDEKHPNKSQINVTINTKNIFTGLKKFDEHLKSDDFLKVKSFPTATFISKKVVITGKNTAKIHGDLTLVGVTKTVVLNVKLNKIGVNPISNKKTAGFSANTVIKRSDFGINYALPAINDEVKLTIDAEANLAE